MASDSKKRGPAVGLPVQAPRSMTPVADSPGTTPSPAVDAASDTGVPAENSVNFYLALREAGVSAELHVYEQGQHGFGLAPFDPVLASWTDRCKDWMRIRGLLLND